MDYEEKYKTALLKAQKLYGKYCINNVLESIFPELAESEYEKIRKELIEHFQWNAQILNDIDNREVIAWLENQVKKKPIEWTDSDEVYFQHILLAIKTSMFYTEEDRDKLVDWFKLLKQRIVNNNE